jgi:hypothetical protein
LPESYKVAINNAWRIRSDFDASVFPSDFPKERQPDETFKGKTYTDIDYMPPINKAKLPRALLNFMKRSLP